MFCAALITNLTRIFSFRFSFFLLLLLLFLTPFDTFQTSGFCSPNFFLFSLSVLCCWCCCCCWWCLLPPRFPFQRLPQWTIVIIIAIVKDTNRRRIRRRWPSLRRSYWMVRQDISFVFSLLLKNTQHDGLSLFLSLSLSLSLIF